MCSASFSQGMQANEGFFAPTAIPDGPYALVVDDDYAILSIVLMLLETEGYTALGISDSQEVLPFLERIHASEQESRNCLPSVVLLDLMMPVVSGYEIAATLSKTDWTKHIPIVVMTADHRVTGLSYIPGASDWMSKPFHVEVLLSKLEPYLTRQ